MKAKSGLFLFIALLLPGCIFIFLKFFGRNEFAVAPLFQQEAPRPKDCPPVTYPYHVPDSMMNVLAIGNDSLVLIVVGSPSPEGQNQLKRVTEEFPNDPVRITSLSASKDATCIFLMMEPFDLVLVDKRGAIRGQYVTDDRDEMDRLLMEIAILLKKY